MQHFSLVFIAFQFFKPAASRRLKAYNHINSIHLLILFFLFPHTFTSTRTMHTLSHNKKCAHLLAVAAVALAAIVFGCWWWVFAFSCPVSNYDSMINTPKYSICKSVFSFDYWPTTSSLSLLFHLSFSFSQTIEFVEYHFHDNTIDPGGCLHSLWFCR